MTENHRRKFAFIGSVTMAFLIFLSACSAQSSGTSAESDQAYMGEMASSASSSAVSAAPAEDSNAMGEEQGYQDSAGAGLTTAEQVAQSTQKIIQNLTYQIETLEFDRSTEEIQKLCEKLGGYIQESSIDGQGAFSTSSLRTAYYVLRIPQQKLSELKSEAEQIGSVLNLTLTTENITAQYFDKESRLKSLRTQETRLLEMLEKADTMADMIELEQALADVTYKIEQLTGELQQYDSLVDYSTVTIHLYEVLKSTEKTEIPVTLGDQIADKFQRSLRAIGNFGEVLLINLIGGSPILILLLVIAAILFFIIKLILKTQEKRRTVYSPQQISGQPEMQKKDSLNVNTEKDITESAKSIEEDKDEHPPKEHF